MRNKHAISYLQEGTGQSICSLSKHLYSIKLDICYHQQTPEFKKDCIIIQKLIYIDIYRTPWNTYIVQAAICNLKKSKNSEWKEIYRQYKTIKQAWTYKRGLMRCKPEEFKNINLEWNSDGFDNSEWR